MSFFSKLRDRLTRSSSKIGAGLDDIVAWGADGLELALSDGDSFNEVDPELFYVTNGNTTDPLLMV